MTKNILCSKMNFQRFSFPKHSSYNGEGSNENLRKLPVSTTRVVTNEVSSVGSGGSGSDDCGGGGSCGYRRGWLFCATKAHVFRMDKKGCFDFSIYRCSTC